MPFNIGSQYKRQVSGGPLSADGQANMARNQQRLSVNHPSRIASDQRQAQAAQDASFLRFPGSPMPIMGGHVIGAHDAIARNTIPSEFDRGGGIDIRPHAIQGRIDSSFQQAHKGLRDANTRSENFMAAMPQGVDAMHRVLTGHSLPPLQPMAPYNPNAPHPTSQQRWAEVDRAMSGSAPHEMATNAPTHQVMPRNSTGVTLTAEAPKIAPPSPLEPMSSQGDPYIQRPVPEQFSQGDPYVNPTAEHMRIMGAQPAPNPTAEHMRIMGAQPAPNPTAEHMRMMIGDDAKSGHGFFSIPPAPPVPGNVPGPGPIDMAAAHMALNGMPAPPGLGGDPMVAALGAKPAAIEPPAWFFRDQPARAIEPPAWFFRDQPARAIEPPAWFFRDQPARAIVGPQIPPQIEDFRREADQQKALADKLFTGEWASTGDAWKRHVDRDAPRHEADILERLQNIEESKARVAQLGKTGVDDRIKQELIDKYGPAGAAHISSVMQANPGDPALPRLMAEYAAQKHVPHIMSHMHGTGEDMQAALMGHGHEHDLPPEILQELLRTRVTPDEWAAMTRDGLPGMRGPVKNNVGPQLDAGGGGFLDITPRKVWNWMMTPQPGFGGFR